MPIVIPQPPLTDTEFMTELAAELNTDPLGMGYNTATTQSAALADKLNLKPEPVAVASREQIHKAQVLTRDLLAEVTKTDWTALSTADKDWLRFLFNNLEVKTGSANMRTSLNNLFPVGSTSRTAMIAAASRDASRAEALWGEGFEVRDTHVAIALNR